MAEFNPQTQDVGVIDQTSASRGTGPNRTFETLFSGLTQTAENVITVRDTENQLDIQKDAQDLFEGVNDEFGVSAPTPDGVTDGLDQIQTLQNALSQGKISEVNYYGRLATLSKQLRSKYPGYESIVDSTIQSVTGTRPANAYRDALFSEMGKIASEASDEEKFKRQYIKENEGAIAAVVGDDFFNNPDAYDFDKVRTEVAKFKGKAALIEAENSELTLSAKRGEFNDKRAARALDRDFAFITQSTLSKAIGANSPSFQDSIDSFVAKGGGTPEELDQFIKTISQAETELRTTLLQRGREKYVTSGLIGNDELNKAVDEALFPIKAAKEAVLGGDFKLAAKYATINKTIADRDMNELLADPIIRAGRGLTEINKTLGDEFFSQRTDQIADIATEITGRTMLGQEDVVKKVIQHGDQKVSRETLNSNFKAIIDPNLQGEKFSNVIDQFFGSKALDFMDPKNVKAEDLEAIYTQFLRPEVTKAIFSKGSEEDKRKYVDWATSKFLSIPAFRAAAGDINAIIKVDAQSATPSARAVFDPKTLRVSIQADNAGSRMADSLGWQPYGRAVNAFNKSISVLKPILDAQGADGQVTVRNLLRDLSISVDGVNPEKKANEAQGAEETGGPLSAIANSNFWGWMYDGLSQPLGEAIAEAKRNPTILPEVPEDGGDIDFLFEQEDYDPLDESFFEQNDLANVVRASAGDLFSPIGETQSDEQRNETRRNLGMGELVTSNRRGRTPDVEHLRPAIKQGLTELQSSWGKTLPIVSGFRDPERNRKAGGAKKSQHIHGNAVDIDVSNLSREERIKLIKLARSQGWGGVGVYPNSLHLDKGSTRAWGPNFRNTSLPRWARDALGG